MIYRSVIHTRDSEGIERGIGSVEGGIGLDVGDAFTHNGETGYVSRIVHDFTSTLTEGVLMTTYIVNLGEAK